MADHAESTVNHISIYIDALQQRVTEFCAWLYFYTFMTVKKCFFFQGASQKDIRKAYKKLSLIYHPDKDTGDHKKFMKVAKAYAA